MAVSKSAPRYFGSVRKLPSGRYQARYTAPDGTRYPARRADGGPLTFDTKSDAEAWLALRHSEVLRNEWLPPAAPKTPSVSLRTFADAWAAHRDLEDRTREHYGQLLRDHVYPTFGDKAVSDVTPADVRLWHASLGTTTGPTARAHAYDLLRTIMGTAVDDELISANPCRIRGAGQAKRVKRIRPATLAELETIVKAVPDKYQLMVLFGAWLALRFGELAELRRSDVDVEGRVVHIRRGVVRTKNGRKVKDPKSEAGKRPVAIPPHLMPLVKDHVREHAAMGRDGLLFPARHGEQLAPSTLYKVYYPAREKAGRPDLRFHDLRHTGAVLAASTGATLAELMARLGHSTPGAALRYQHAAEERDRVIADALSKLVTSKVVPIKKSKRKADSSVAQIPADPPTVQPRSTRTAVAEDVTEKTRPSRPTPARRQRSPRPAGNAPPGPPATLPPARRQRSPRPAPLDLDTVRLERGADPGVWRVLANGAEQPILVGYLDTTYSGGGGTKRWLARTEHWTTLPGRPLTTRKEALLRLVDNYQRAAGA